ncbi:hypothetical protein BDF22DRAFT_740177 [Syncephalis plumigaleata]|nr:hypothetical protein BDF22DRAFT_740177 [Syncephalis plumigaleata]
MSPIATAFASSAATSSRRSGLQRQVLSLYRSCLRAINKKPIESQPRFRQFARRQFERDDVKMSDIAAIEHLLRSGQRQLEAYGQPSVRDIVVPPS